MFEDRIAALEAEYQAVEAELADSATHSDPDRLRDLSRRHKELGEIVRAWHDLTAAREDLTAAREMLTEASGDDREIMRLEADDAESRVKALEERIQELLLPKDPNEGRNVIMEIRGAVGGDEANLFARVLYDMYLRYAATKKWKFDWPVFDERQAAAMCYTSGTTGNPKGVAYSHRSTYLHSLASTSAATLGIASSDRVLVVVPQFHANAWGIPYASWLAGADLIMPKQHLQAEPLVRLIEEERPTFAGAVPSIWNEVLRYAEAHDSDLSSFRGIVCGGSAVPAALMRRFQERWGVPIIQAWGMTETSPLGAVAIPPRGAEGEDAWSYRQKAGRVTFGVELRVVDGEGNVAPRDGATVGEFEVRGPWVTASYYGDPTPDRFRDGWLRTGDVGTVDEQGYLTITDRTKDVIKTGGEWISSVELENALMAHPDVFEAAVVAVPDPRWDERPLACVVPVEGSSLSAEELAVFLADRVARWWVPERWAFIGEVPKTSVGKFDKKVLRAEFAKGDLDVVTIERPAAS
ncbi:MAG: long-chain-fatty-acid--CoA ligase [Acidimicrobiales bacterium]